MTRIGALVPVRLGSERLPSKALLPLGGRPVITRLLDRIFASRHLSPDRVVVCTTEDAADDALIPVVEAAGARIFRGSRDDIIDRFCRAMRHFEFDAVLEVDGDDPFADPLYMDLVLDRLLDGSSPGAVVTEGLPLGMGSKALSRRGVETVWERHTTERNDTGFMYYFTKAGLCETATVSPIDTGHTHATARLTLDYPEDLAFFEAVQAELGTSGRVFGCAEIVDLLRRRPELVAINAGLNERYWARTHEMTHLEYERDGRTYTVEI